MFSKLARLNVKLDMKMKIIVATDVNKIKNYSKGFATYPWSSLAADDIASLGQFEKELGKSAASFCHKVAALVPDIFCNFYFVKNYTFEINSATSEAREK